jgi:hypothetical protein
MIQVYLGLATQRNGSSGRLEADEGVKTGLTDVGREAQHDHPMAASSQNAGDAAGEPRSRGLTAVWTRRQDVDMTQASPGHIRDVSWPPSRHVMCSDRDVNTEYPGGRGLEDIITVRLTEQFKCWKCRVGYVSRTSKYWYLPPLTALN